MLLKNKKGKELNEENEIGNCLIRMERSYRDVMLLKNSLCSYSCEPQTYKLFEEFEDLKLNLELLRISHLKLIDALRPSVNFVELKLQQVNDIVNKTISLKEEVHNYINLVKK
ncbi:hypothetical protein [uncultured Maribacter sp.]|uniref:hypothetical protein n=1 Tax=uncultured Maribacter sp. TaxID=431308 RepID=UPI00260980BE|nr:hypothetical protein [uncultured Maribacter sp.]